MRARHIYRVVITDVHPEQPVQMLRQWDEHDQTDDYRIKDEDRVSVPYRGGKLWFVPVDVLYPWNGNPEIEDSAVRYFTVGTTRAYLSRKGADHKAAIWRAHGCRVRIDKSDPVIWNEGEAS